MSQPCPCGRPLPLEGCCGRFLHQGLLPATAEELMRSRYTAFVLGAVDYLCETHPGAVPEQVEQWSRQARFTGLEVVEVKQGGPEDTRGEVEFVASYRMGAETHLHRERSRFERQEGRWLYIEGQVPRQAPVRREAGPGRNGPCPCGSGKKYKKCCGSG